MTKNYLLSKIGAAPPEMRLVIDDQDAYDIMKQVTVKHKKCTEYYDRIAEDFYSPYILVTCRRLFNFCKANIAYREESINKQYTSSPQTILSRGYGDCKSYALFIGGVLDALKRMGEPIDWCYRFASEDYSSENAQPGHVFIVVNTPQGEVWIDPVLQYFNQDHDFASWQDRKVKDTVSVGRITKNGKSKIGATEKQTGQALMKLAPTLAEVPVAALAVEAAGVILNFFGDNFIYSSDVRGLIQKYQYFVQGNSAVTQASKADQSLKDKAQAWFSLVLGVPIYDDLRYDALRGEDHSTFSDLPNRWDYNARVQKYKSFGTAEAAVPDAQVLAAAYIADGLDDRTTGNYPTKPGAWAGALPAAAVIASPDATPSLYIDQNGNLTNPNGTPYTGGSNMNLVLLAAAAVAVFLLIK